MSRPSTLMYSAREAGVLKEMFLLLTRYPAALLALGSDKLEDYADSPLAVGPAAIGGGPSSGAGGAGGAGAGGGGGGASAAGAADDAAGNPVARESTSEEVCLALVNLARATGRTLAIVKAFVEQDFRENAGSDSEGSIMRGNCLASRLTKALLAKIGRDYLQMVIGPVVQRIAVTEGKKMYEIDPSKVDPATDATGDASKNVKVLLERVEAILASVTNQATVDQMPTEIRVIAGYFSALAEQYAPSQRSALVGGFLFLRWINPALTTPETYGLLPRGKSTPAPARRNLILMSKVLQNLSNGVSFGKKEKFMSQVNVYITDNTARIQRYLQAVVNFTQSSTTAPEPDAINPEDLHVMHRILSNPRNMQLLLTAINDREGGAQFTKLADQLGSYQSKISYAFLGDHDRKVLASLLLSQRDEAQYIGEWISDDAEDAGEKEEKTRRILVVGQHRILCFRPGSGNNKLRAAHMLDLLEVRSKTQTELKLKFKSFSLSLVSRGGEEGERAEDAIEVIRRAFADSFFSMPTKLWFKVAVEPSSRLQPQAHILGSRAAAAIASAADEEDASDLDTSAAAVIAVDLERNSRCGGLVGTYRSLCNYYEIEPNFDVIWHFSHLPSRVRVFDLKKFQKSYSEHPLRLTDVGPLFWSLRFNFYFTRFTVKMKLDRESFLDLAEMLKFNRHMTELSLSKCNGVGVDYKNVFGGIAANRGTRLSTISVESDNVGDVGAAALAELVKKPQLKLLNLHLEQCGFTAKGLQALLGALATKFGPSGKSHTRLARLCLSDNKLGAASADLASFVMEGGESLLSLAIANTAPASLEGALDAVASNSLHLQELDISGNKMKAPDMSALIKLALSLTNLRELRMESTKPSVDDVRTLVTSLNPQLALDLYLGDNGLGFAGAKELAYVPLKMTAIRTLDLRDNDMGDEGLALLFEALCSNTSITRLNVDRNFSTHAKHRVQFTDAVVKLLQANSTLESLSMQGGGRFSEASSSSIGDRGSGFIGSSKSLGGQIKAHVADFLFALGNNTTLTHLDISHHAMGNTGVIALSRALLINRTVSSVRYDGSLAGILGYDNLLDTLKTNTTVKELPLPVFDVGDALKRESAKQADIVRTLAEIGKLVLRNQTGAADDAGDDDEDGSA